MTSGALIQIVATGQQDYFLYGNPVATLWKSVHKKITPFAMESVPLNFTGQTSFGRKCSLVIPRNADLVSEIYLQVDLPALANASSGVKWTRKVGHAMIAQQTLTIGASTIDTQYGEWLEIYYQFALRSDKKVAYNNMIGDTTLLTTSAASIPAATVYVPMRFFFNRLPGLALPLIALQFHNVQVDITFRDASQLIICADPTQTYPTSGIPQMNNCQAWADFVYLDNQERQSFVNEQAEILIDQVQFTGAESYATSQVQSRLSFNHPTKALFWMLRSSLNEAANEWLNFTNAVGYGGADTISMANIKLNGTDRYAARDAAYHNLIQPMQHAEGGVPDRGFYLYSFGAGKSVFEHQPTGTLNMSRVDNIILSLTSQLGSTQYSLLTFALNYNILRYLFPSFFHKVICTPMTKCICSFLLYRYRGGLGVNLSFFLIVLINDLLMLIWSLGSCICRLNNLICGIIKSLINLFTFLSIIFALLKCMRVFKSQLYEEFQCFLRLLL